MRHPVDVHVGKRVRHRRWMVGMTQQQLADEIGMTRQTIVAIEKGKYSPSLEAAFRIATVFGVPLEAVFSYEAE